jgi:hypothetical protein
VVIASCSIDLKEYTKGVGNLGIAGSHTMTIVSNGDGNPTIFSSLNIDGKNVFGKNHTADVNALGAREITVSVFIKPPEGMTSEEFDKAVINAGEFMETRESLNYSAFPSRQSEGNCHTCTRNLIDADGSQIPKDFDPLGLSSDLHTDRPTVDHLIE